MTNNNSEEYLLVPDAVRQLKDYGVSVTIQSVYNRVKRETISYKKFGKKKKIKLSELMRIYAPNILPPEKEKKTEDIDKSSDTDTLELWSSMEAKNTIIGHVFELVESLKRGKASQQGLAKLKEIEKGLNVIKIFDGMNTFYRATTEELRPIGMRILESEIEKMSQTIEESSRERHDKRIEEYNEHNHKEIKIKELTDSELEELMFDDVDDLLLNRIIDEQERRGIFGETNIGEIKKKLRLLSIESESMAKSEK